MNDNDKQLNMQTGCGHPPVTTGPHDVRNDVKISGRVGEQRHGFLKLLNIDKGGLTQNWLLPFVIRAAVQGFSSDVGEHPTSVHFYA